MLRISKTIVDKIRKAERASDLYEHLQAAIELEHATIPPYLTALYSIKPDTNQEVANIFFSVVREEMLHMVIVANVLNAIDGSPKIDDPELTKPFPKHLPMVNQDLEVGLAPLSKDLIKNVFLQIETSTDPEDYPNKPVPESSLKTSLLAEEEYKTIGEFYEAIIEKIKELGDEIFKNPPRNQVINEKWFPKTELFEIRDVNTATSALELIIEQGEGSVKEYKSENNQEKESTVPFDPQNQPAHYYRFAQILKGGKLIEYPKDSGEYVYDTNQPVVLNEDDTYPFVENSRAYMYSKGSRARYLVDQFNYSYTNLLKGLQKAFDGDADFLNSTIAVMFELKLQAQTMGELIINSGENKGKCVAPSFEYQTLDTQKTCP